MPRRIEHGTILNQGVMYVYHATAVAVGHQVAVGVAYAGERKGAAHRGHVAVGNKGWLNRKIYGGSSIIIFRYVCTYTYQPSLVIFILSMGRLGNYHRSSHKQV